MATSVERALQGSLGPVNTVPTVVDGSVGTTSQLLTADSTADRKSGIRRVRLVNTHASNLLTLAIKAFGDAGTTYAVTDGMRILPGGEVNVVVSANLSLIIVASAASTTYNAVISDT